MTDQGPEQPGDFDQPTPEPPPPPAPAPGVSGVGAPADLGTRFLARLIDHILLGIVTFVIIIPLVIAAAFADVSTGFGGFFGGFGIGSLIASIVTAVIVIGYFALMEAQVGQTVGKMAMGIKTEGPGGNKPSLEEALKRNGWYALAIIPWIGGLAQLAVAVYIAVTISNSQTRTGWHDTFAGGTRVVRAK